MPGIQALPANLLGPMRGEQAILGQLKVQLQADDAKSPLASLFSRSKAKK